MRISQSFASKAQAAGIHLALQMPPGELPTLADRDRLGQVLINLLENALRYTPAGGQVSVSASQHAGQAVLSVRDSGPGFPAGSEQQVFSRFFRGDQSRTRDSGGSGLGLAIVSALVQAHGGAVVARNALSGGAEVEVRLPLHEEPPEAEPGAMWRPNRNQTSRECGSRDSCASTLTLMLLSLDWDASSGCRELVFDAPIWGSPDREPDRLAAWQTARPQTGCGGGGLGRPGRRLPTVSRLGSS